MEILIELLPLFMLIGLILFVVLGYPVAFSIAAIALLFALIGEALGIRTNFMQAAMGAFTLRIPGIIENFLLVAVPLFVYMGVMLERSGLADDLLETLGILLRKVPGSLAISVIAMGAILAASTGIIGATVVTMTVLALPVMLQTWLQQGTFHWRDLRSGNAWPNYSTEHCAVVACQYF